MDVVALFAHIYQNRKVLFLDYAPYEFVFEDATRRSVRNTELTCDENDIVGIQHELDTHWGVHKRLLCPALRLPSAMGRPVSPSLNQSQHQAAGATSANDTNIMHLNLHTSPKSSTGSDVPNMTGSPHEFHGWQNYQSTQQDTARSLPSHFGMRSMYQQHRQATQYSQQTQRMSQKQRRPLASVFASHMDDDVQSRTYNSHDSYGSYGDTQGQQHDHGIENNSLQYWKGRNSTLYPVEQVTQNTRATSEDNSNMIALVMAAMERIEAEKVAPAVDEANSCRPKFVSDVHGSYHAQSQQNQQQLTYSDAEYFTTTYTPTTSHASTLTPGSRESSRAATPDHIHHMDNHESEIKHTYSGQRHTRNESSHIDMEEQQHYSEHTTADTSALERKSSAEKKLYYMRPGPLGKKVRNERLSKFVVSDITGNSMVGGPHNTYDKSGVPIATKESIDRRCKTWRPW
ncbi:hypothetical protein SARC_07175, partial [Sphaeroforma arctica JP610]